MPSLSERLKQAAAAASQPLTGPSSDPLSSPSPAASSAPPSASPASTTPSKAAAKPSTGLAASPSAPTSLISDASFHLPTIDSLSSSFSGLRRSISLTRPSPKVVASASPLRPPTNSGESPSTAAAAPPPQTASPALPTSPSTPSLSTIVTVDDGLPPLPPPNPDDPSTYPLPPSPTEVKLPLPSPTEEMRLMEFGGDEVKAEVDEVAAAAVEAEGEKLEEKEEGPASAPQHTSALTSSSLTESSSAPPTATAHPLASSTAETALPSSDTTSETLPTPSSDPSPPIPNDALTPNSPSSSSLPPSDLPPEHDLQSQLKSQEEQIADLQSKLSASLAQSDKISLVLRELTPLEGIGDDEGLRAHLENLGGKVEMSMTEMKRLNGLLQLQESRQTELRETHKASSSSFSSQIDALRSTLSTTNTTLSSTQASLLSVTNEKTLLQNQLTAVRADLVKAEKVAKEEEEKRVKAISLLKTVRGKLVKADQGRDEALADRETLRLAHLAREDELKKEADKLRSDLSQSKADKDRDVRTLREKFESEVKSTRATLERENRTRREEMELRAVTVAATHAKDLATLKGKLTTVQASVKGLGEGKDELFGELQTRSEELEGEKRARGKLEVELGEAEWKVKEVGERCAVLEEDVENGRRSIEELTAERDKLRSLGSSNGHLDFSSATNMSPSSSSDGSSSQLPSTPREASLLSTLSTLRSTHAETLSSLAHLTASHAQAETEWSLLISTRTAELEACRRTLRERESELRGERERWEEERKGWERIREEEEKGRGERERRGEEGRWEEVRIREESWREDEAALRDEISSLQSKVTSIESSNTSYQAQLATLRQTTKTLKDELRKLQSSAQLLERQRNPGVGYWSSSSASSSNHPPQGSQPFQNHGFAASRSSISSISERQGSVSSVSLARSGSDSGTTVNGGGSGGGGQEEEVNLEYLRNVILQFLEHKEMRANLVRVLSVILHFTPSETRRLIAGVS